MWPRSIEPGISTCRLAPTPANTCLNVAALDRARNLVGIATIQYGLLVLQCGRARSSAESIYQKIDRALKNLASMWPRSIERGIRISCRLTAARRPRFNVAALDRARN